MNIHKKYKVPKSRIKSYLSNDLENEWIKKEKEIKSLIIKLIDLSNTRLFKKVLYTIDFVQNYW